MPRTTASSSGDAPGRDPRSEILAAAADLLGEGGEDGLTIRRLALRSGYTSPAIYQEFGDKAGLLDAVLARAIGALAERLERLEIPSDPAGAMRLHFKTIVRFGREHPTHYRLMEALQPDQEPPIPAAVAVRELVAKPLEGMASSPEQLELLRQALWTLLHGLISLPALRPDVAWREDLEDVVFDALLTGLLGRDDSGQSS